MKSIIAIYTWLRDNWALIVISLVIIVDILQLVKKHLKKEQQEEIDNIIKKISTVIDRYVFVAEISRKGFKNAGTLKRSEVIEKLYNKYPELEDVANQEEVIEKIDNLIDKAVKNIDKIEETSTVTFKLNEDNIYHTDASSEVKQPEPAQHRCETDDEYNDEDDTYITESEEDESDDSENID